MSTAVCLHERPKPRGVPCQTLRPVSALLADWLTRRCLGHARDVRLAWQQLQHKAAADKIFLVGCRVVRCKPMQVRQLGHLQPGERREADATCPSRCRTRSSAGWHAGPVWATPTCSAAGLLHMVARLLSACCGAHLVQARVHPHVVLLQVWVCGRRAEEQAHGEVVFVAPRQHPVNAVGELLVAHVQARARVEAALSCASSAGRGPARMQPAGRSLQRAPGASRTSGPAQLGWGRAPQCPAGTRPRSSTAACPARPPAHTPGCCSGTSRLQQSERTENAYRHFPQLAPGQHRRSQPAQQAAPAAHLLTDSGPAPPRPPPPCRCRPCGSWRCPAPGPENANRCACRQAARPPAAGPAGSSVPPPRCSAGRPCTGSLACARGQLLRFRQGMGASGPRGSSEQER